MKLPKHYTVHCPECGATVRLPINLREAGADRSGKPGNLNYDLSVDPTPLRDHIANVHDAASPREGM